MNHKARQEAKRMVEMYTLPFGMIEDKIIGCDNAIKECERLSGSCAVLFNDSEYWSYVINEINLIKNKLL